MSISSSMEKSRLVINRRFLGGVFVPPRYNSHVFSISPYWISQFILFYFSVIVVDRNARFLFTSLFIHVFIYYLFTFF